MSIWYPSNSATYTDGETFPYDNVKIKIFDDYNQVGTVEHNLEFLSGYKFIGDSENFFQETERDTIIIKPPIIANRMLIWSEEENDDYWTLQVLEGHTGASNVVAEGTKLLPWAPGLLNLGARVLLYNRDDAYLEENIYNIRFKDTANDAATDIVYMGRIEGESATEETLQSNAIKDSSPFLYHSLVSRYMVHSIPMIGYTAFTDTAVEADSDRIVVLKMTNANDRKWHVNFYNDLDDEDLIGLRYGEVGV